MNDRSEYTYAKDQFIKAYQNQKVCIEEIPRFMVEIKLATHEPATTMMIGCFTKERDDIGLWDRYAANGAGCVIGIDATWLAERAGVTIRRVSYSLSYFKKFVNGGLSMLQEHHEKNPDDRDELGELAAFFVLDLYAFKDPRFRSEKEVRVSRLCLTDEKSPYGIVDEGGRRSDGTPAPSLPIGQRTGPYGPKRFIDLPLQDAETRSAIRSVTIGPRADPATMKAIEAACAGYPGIKIRQSSAPFR